MRCLSFLIALLVALPASLAAERRPDNTEITGSVLKGGVSVKGTFATCGHKKRVNCIVDGDTFWYRGEKYRISDINTPEISQPGCKHERELGEAAQAALLKEFNAGGIRLVKAESRDVDRYGRKLRVAMRDGQSIGDTLIKRGLAHKWGGHRLNWCDGSR